MSCEELHPKHLQSRAWQEVSNSHLTLQEKEQKMNLLLTSHQQEEQTKKDLENKVKDLEQALMERSNTPGAPEPEETPVTEEEKPRGWWSRLFS